MSIASSATVIDDSINGIKWNYSDLMAIFILFFLFSISSNGMSNYTQNKELKKMREWSSHVVPLTCYILREKLSKTKWAATDVHDFIEGKNIFYTNFNFRSVLHAATITLHTILLSVCASSSFLYIIFSSTSDIYFLCVNKQKYSNLFIKKIEKKKH